MNKKKTSQGERIRSLWVLAVLLEKRPTIEKPLGLREFAREATFLATGKRPKGNENLVMKPDTPERSIAPINAFFKALGSDAQVTKDGAGIYFTKLPSLDFFDPQFGLIPLLLRALFENKPTENDPLTVEKIIAWAQDEKKGASFTPLEIDRGIQQLNPLFQILGFHYTVMAKEGAYYFSSFPLESKQAEILFDLVDHCPLFTLEEKEGINEQLSRLSSSLLAYNDYRSIFKEPEEEEKPLTMYDQTPCTSLMKESAETIETLIKTRGYFTFKDPAWAFGDPVFYQPLYLAKRDEDYLFYALEIKEREDSFAEAEEEATVIVRKLSQIHGIISYTLKGTPAYQDAVKAYGLRFGINPDLCGDPALFTPKNDAFNWTKALAYDLAGTQRWFAYKNGQWTYDHLETMKIRFSGTPFTDRQLQAFNITIKKGSLVTPTPVPKDCYPVSGTLELIGDGDDLLHFALSASGPGFQVLAPESMVGLVGLSLSDALDQYFPEPLKCNRSKKGAK